MQIAMIQDKMVPTQELEPVYLDRGTFFGDGVYEVLRSYNGKIFALEEHLQRLANNLTAIEINGVDIDQVGQRVLRAFETAAIPTGRDAPVVKPCLGPLPSQANRNQVRSQPFNH